MTDKTYRALLIDPEKRTIEETVFDPVQGCYAQVGAEGLDFFRIADHGKTFDQGVVDDTGLARGKPIFAFKFRKDDGPIGGRCLIIGADMRGKTADATMTLAFVRDEVEWLGLILPRVVWEHTERGASAKVTYEAVA